MYLNWKQGAKRVNMRSQFSALNFDIRLNAPNFLICYNILSYRSSHSRFAAKIQRHAVVLKYYIGLDWMSFKLEFESAYSWNNLNHHQVAFSNRLAHECMERIVLIDLDRNQRISTQLLT